MNEERKPLGLDAFEMPNTPNTNNGPMIDSAMPTIDNSNVEPVAPVIDSVFDMPVIDDAMSTVNNSNVEPVASVVNNQTNSAPVIDSMFDMPVIDSAISTMNTPVVDIPVNTNNAPMIDSAMPIDNMVTDNSVPMVDSYVDSMVNNTPTTNPAENFDYNFDFESQVNNNNSYMNTVSPVTPEPVVNMESEPAAPVSPVPIIMPGDDMSNNISSGDSSNEGIISGPGNQMDNTFNSYINDSDTTGNTLRTANIVKETQTTKDSKSGLLFLFIIFLIIAIFIFLLPNLI